MEGPGLAILVPPTPRTWEGPGLAILVFPPQNVDDAMTVLPKLATGLDVNVRFTGVSDFEYTPECSIFDLLGIPLYHGWLVDPQVRTGGVIGFGA